MRYEISLNKRIHFSQLSFYCFPLYIWDGSGLWKSFYAIHTGLESAFYPQTDQKLYLTTAKLFPGVWLFRSPAAVTKGHRGICWGCLFLFMLIAQHSCYLSTPHHQIKWNISSWWRWALLFSSSVPSSQFVEDLHILRNHLMENRYSENPDCDSFVLFFPQIIVFIIVFLSFRRGLCGASVSDGLQMLCTIDVGPLKGDQSWWHNRLLPLTRQNLLRAAAYASSKAMN